MLVAWPESPNKDEVQAWRLIPVIERAIETAALMLGSDRSRGYCLEMICADFLAGANLDNGGSGDAAVLGDQILPVSARSHHEPDSTEATAPAT
jgi:hypothetical protein